MVPLRIRIIVYVVLLLVAIGFAVAERWTPR